MDLDARPIQHLVMSEPIPDLPKLGRRIFLTAVPLMLHGISPLPEVAPAKPPQEIEDRKGELRRIVKRLIAIIEEHRASALRLEVELNASALDIVLRALEAETRREDPVPILQEGGDQIRSYVLSSLFDDLLAEPSNILHTTHVAEGVVRYEAMDAAFWQKCVAKLRESLAIKRTQLTPTQP